MITVECSRVDCEESFEAGRDADWSFDSRKHSLIFAGIEGYGPRVLIVAMPEDWKVEYVSTGDAVIHCPEHANA